MRSNSSFYQGRLELPGFSVKITSQKTWVKLHFQTPPSTLGRRAAMAASAITSGEILLIAAAFTSEALSNSNLRFRLVSVLRRKLQTSDQNVAGQLKVAAETLESAISTSSSSNRSSSLRLAEKLLLSHPDTLLSSFLQSLLYALLNRHAEAAHSLLNIFSSDPSMARSEIAPMVFEELFIIHLLPVLQSFKDQRYRILSSLSSKNLAFRDERSRLGEPVVVSGTRLLSKMSGGQTSELKELERDYELVLDENCRLLVGYFREVLRNENESKSIPPPSVILQKTAKSNEFEFNEDGQNKVEQIELRDCGYNNPTWAEGEKSVESSSSSSSSSSITSKSRSLYPQRVSPKIFRNQRSWRTLNETSPNPISGSELASSSEDNLSNYSSESESEPQEKNRKMALFEPRRSQIQKQKQPIYAESISSPERVMVADSDDPPGGGKCTPPKDFVCPITSHIFDDPVTLETGQTYERIAIQEWIERGNSTCPITRQKLQSTQLPKTNYVLKRLIASWREQNPGYISIHSDNPDKDTGLIFNSALPVQPSTSPNSVISQASMDGTFSELRLAITKLCMSEILRESEKAVLGIEQFWQEMNMGNEIQTMLSKPAVVNGFVEILFNSVDPRVLRASVFLLCELGSRDKTVIQTLTQVDSDVECIVALFKNGLLEAIVLIYLLRPSTASLIEMDMVESLLVIIKKKQGEFSEMCLRPKTASILLLRQILGSSEESIIPSIARTLASAKAIKNITESLEAEWSEERIAAVGILLRCMQGEGKCRHTIADKAELAPVVESFTCASDEERFEIINFFSELVKLNRRTFNQQVLHIIKDEGAFSTMHTLLVYLQTAPQDQCPAVAGLLLQLDLLVEPRKMSIYREEAIDTLISCIRNSDFPSAQVAAAETIVSLQGRFSSSGKSLTRAILLKRAGLDKSYRTIMQVNQLSNTPAESEENLEEEQAADDWERKMAFVLVNHEFGLLFEALAEGLKNRNQALYSPCFLSATWLIHMLTVLPDTGIRGAARVCLLKRFVSMFRSAKDTEEKALSLLALSSFMHDPEDVNDLTSHMKDILKGLRELKKSCILAVDMLKFLSGGNNSSIDLWSHKELVQVDCSANGEVLSIVSFRDKIFSGHSDGTIKVWTGRGSILHLIHETREHAKAVTSLAILESGERLYSGSLDRTARTWSIGSEAIYCVEVHDMKDQVNNLVVANSIACFIPQGAGIKVHSWSGASKLLNPNKHVKCLTLVHGKLYCGCHDNSIQEIDLATGTLSSIQSGSRKLLGKANPVYALQVHDGLIYSGSSSLDGAAVKIWSAANYNLVGSLASTADIRSLVVSSELIYMGGKSGTVEIWCRKKLTRVETLQTGTNSKVQCMTLDGDEEILVVGTSDGCIQAWELS